MPGDVTRLYRVRYQVLDQASVPLAQIARAFVGINLESETAISHARLFGRELAALRGEVPGLRQIEGAFRGIASAIRPLDTQLGQINLELVKTAAGGKALGSIRGEIVAAQRAAYGLKMNLQEGNAALAGLVATGGGLGATTGHIKSLQAATGGAAKSTNSLVGGMTKFVAKMSALQLATQAATAFGESMKEASEFAASSANEVIRIRDGLRELANLQGKPGVDDATLRGAMALRQATGMNEADSRQFQEQYLGSLPLAEKKGNIDRATANAAAKEGGRSSVRGGRDAKTAGDLVGSVGSFGQITTAKQATGQVQQIIDQLNDGRGNLTPLVKELMKGAAATVGLVNAFRTLPERAAAISVTTGIVGSAGQSSTALGAAIRGLTGFTKKQGKALAEHGITSGQDLPTMIERIAPLIENAEKAGKNASAALAEAGFGNKTDRDAIIGLVRNKKVLREAVEKVREDRGSTAKATAAGNRAIRLNREFYGSDKAAANRVAEANLASAKVERGIATEPMAIARKNAEADLLQKQELDTTGSLLSQRLRGLVAPQWLTGVDQRQRDIDIQARRNLVREGKRVGVRVPQRNFGTAEGALTEDLNRYGPQIQQRGGNPYGGNSAAGGNLGNVPDVGKKLDRIAEALEKKEQERAANRPLPVQPPVFGAR